MERWRLLTDKKDHILVLRYLHIRKIPGRIYIKVLIVVGV